MFWITRAFIREFEALVRTVRNIRGPGVRVDWGRGVTITPPKQRWERPVFPSDSNVTVYVDSARSANAWYKAYVFTTPAEHDTTLSAGLSTVGTYLDGDEVSALNLQEIIDSETGHDLTHEDNEGQRVFTGYFPGSVDEEGRRVVYLNGIWIGCQQA